MKKISRKNKVVSKSYAHLILSSVIISVLACLLSFSLKHLTEHVEELIFNHVNHFNALVFILLPSVGITLIYFLRKFLFQKKKNKGITEIYKTLDKRKDHLPFFKVPSHYINGFLTVIFGGSTGVEVSTVVATATLGNTAYKYQFSAQKYKRELICAGVVAGVAVLFSSPLAGLFFAIEVIARKINGTIIISTVVSSLAAWAFIYLFDNHYFFNTAVEGWHLKALPFFLVLSLCSSVLSVYFTWLVIKIKSIFGRISNNFLRVNLGAIAVGLLILALPELYGDSYHGLHHILGQMLTYKYYSIGILFLLVMLKPLAASLTLGAGGDGGVFAPSIVAGAFLGMLFAYSCNTFLDTNLIVFNCVLIGAACTLAGSIFGVLTAVFLICSLAANGFALFFPIILCCFVAKFIAQRIIPYNVYTYEAYKESQSVR